MRQLLRKYLPEKYMQFLMKLRLYFSIENIAYKLIKSLGISKAVNIKQNLIFLGELDYPRDQVVMNLNSYIQIGRLAACNKEPETIAWLEKYMKPGLRFYDIGANVGAYSFVASSVAKNDCLIYAFEPSFSTYNALCENIHLNSKQGKIIPVNVALMNKTSLFNLHYSSLFPGAAEHDLENGNEGGNSVPSLKYTQPILGFRLDDLVDQFDFSLPDLMKIDVDGAEYDVLRGAAKVLSSTNLQTLLVEIDEGQPLFNDTIAFMVSNGYVVEEKYPRGKSTTLHNYIFIKSGDWIL